MADLDLALARAVALGVIARESLPPEVLEHIGPLLELLAPNAESDD